MRQAISYARFSSDIKAEGSSKRKQAENFAGFCKQHNLEPASVSFIDKGKSGYKGHHRQGAFGSFLQAAKEGFFPRGSVLVVEALDRFSREEPLEAASTLKAICKSGIDIGIVNKGQIYTHADLSDMGKVISLIVDMCAAHDFSSKLAMRLKKAHEQKRAEGGRNIRNEKRKPKNCPSWIVLDTTGEYKLNPETYTRTDKKGKRFFCPSGELMRKACLMAIDGHGMLAIGKALGIPSARHLPLRERTLIGEYQPRLRQGKARIKTGEPIQGFYPPLLSLVEFRALQDALDSRLNKGNKKGCGGKRGEFCTNLFSMVKNTQGEKLVIIRHSKGNTANLVSNRSLKEGGRVLMDYQTVETTLLACLAHSITPAMLSPVQAKAESEADRVKARIADLRARIEVWENEAMEGAQGLTKLISKATEKIETLSAHHETLLRQAAHNQRNDLDSVIHLIETQQGKKGAELLDLRTRLKSLISGMVESIVIDRKGTDPRALTFLITLKSGVMLDADATMRQPKLSFVRSREMAG